MAKTGITAFKKTLGKYRRILSKQQISTIKGQALSGNLEAARKGLNRIINERGIDNATRTGNFDR